MVEDSRFCHKCGRPTSGEAEIRVEAPRIILTPPVPPPKADVRISFSNPAVLRVAFAAATLSILLDLTPFLGLLAILWSMGAGFLAVWLYRKRSGMVLTVGNGAKLGWITGVFTFVIMTALVTTGAIMSGGQWAGEFRKQLNTMWAQDPRYQEALRAFENPATLATAIFVALFLFFILLSLASVAGGALGARFSNKE